MSDHGEAQDDGSVTTDEEEQLDDNDRARLVSQATSQRHRSNKAAKQNDKISSYRVLVMVSGQVMCRTKRPWQTVQQCLWQRLADCL